MKYPSVTRVLKWIVLIGIYIWLTSLCSGVMSIVLLGLGASTQSNFIETIMSGLSAISYCLVPIVIIGGVFALFTQAYRRDRIREEKATDDFRHLNLLYRYGARISQTTFSFDTKPEWSSDQIAQFADNLRDRVAAQVKARFTNAAVTNPFYVSDKDQNSDKRAFLRIQFTTMRGSSLTQFAYYGVSGKTIIVHYITRIRGRYAWHDVVDFVITGPITVWGWGMAWLNNEYSILAALSTRFNNSYDLIDLTTQLRAISLVLLTETQTMLDEHGLLSDLLKQVIVNNITNTQEVNINQSSGVSLGNIGNTVATVARSIASPTA